jgi:hypothetical protein
MTKKKAPLSKQDASFRQTPRARYNDNFVSKLRKRLEKEPEADLDEDISKYDRRRLKKLRGTAIFLWY